ncbi:SprT-like,High mobility group box domain [Cinara cedri]|uniref:SprT-like,High mobility group box domain n=1 Tax=Cinara cedri TaxID=506608 RepID=A0A5E4MWA0_9HEMI|nr:SprT-like,High mobility group box domain [Cinara cedri]
MSDKENDNFNDYSFKLMNSYKQKSKKKKDPKKTFNFNDLILDEIDLTNEPYINTKMNETIKYKFNHVKNSDQENDNLSDSSLKFMNVRKRKSKRKKTYNNNMILDEIDLTKESNNELNGLKLKNKKTNKDGLTDCNVKSYFNESVKSTTHLLPNISYKSKDQNDNTKFKIVKNLNSEDYLHNTNKGFSNLEYNDLNPENLKDKSFFQNSFITPKKNDIQTNDLVESAKLLDRFYGNEWRDIDGVISTKKTTKHHQPIDNVDIYGNEHILNNTNNSEIENSFSCGIFTKTRNYIKKKGDIQNEVNDTSKILENFSLSENNDNQLNSIAVLDHQINLKTSLHNTNPHNNIKNISKSSRKTSRKYGNIKTDICLNHQSNMPIKSNLEAKLSFLSSLSTFTGSMNCNPEAEKYKFKFKKNKDDLVSVLFKLFNEEVFNNKLPADMNFKWNARLRTTAGACFNRRSVKINEKLECERVSRIELSSKIIDTAERLRDTLIHELCHAACWIFNGIAEGHGPSWKSWANKAMEIFPELPIIKRCHSYEVQTKFTYKCKKCGYSFGRHSKSLNLEKKRCGHCYGEFELIVNKINYNSVSNNNLPVVYTDPVNELYNLNDVPQKSNPSRKPSKFALFVKENYSRVKRENPLSKHGEIMKLLGEKFATSKTLTSDEIFDKLLDNELQLIT